MKQLNNEKGYALIIVLFAIVFITVITAVFMRGALSNRVQETTVDENNLVVVSAESGLEYYTWKLKQVYDENELEAEFIRLENEARTAKAIAAAQAKQKGIAYVDTPIDYVEIQNEIVRKFLVKLEDRKTTLLNESAIELVADAYRHKLVAAEIILKTIDGDIFVTVEGMVGGELPQSAKLQKKSKDLTFSYTYIFPKVELAGGNTPVDPDELSPSGGSLVTMPSIKSPRLANSPKAPADIKGIIKPKNACTSSTGNLSNLDCYISNKHEANFSINNSMLFVDNYLTSWGTIDIVGSSINIKNQIEAANLNIKNTEIVVGSTLKGNSSISLNNSKVKTKKFEQTADLNINNSDVIVDTSITSGKNSIQNSKIIARDFNGGTTTFNGVQLTIANSLEVQTANIGNSIISTNTYKANGQADFVKTDLTITTNYNSGGASFINSNLYVGVRMDTGGGLFYVEGSEVRIKGDAHTANGSTIKNSVLHIDGYFLHTSKPLDAEDSDVFVGGKVTATNGTNLDDVNMIVLGDYQSSTKFKLDDTNLNIGGILTLGNGGELEESLLIAKQIKSSTTLKLDDSVVSTNYLTSDIMTMDDSKVCAIDFDVRKLTMDDDSKIYYSNSFKTSKESKYKSNDVIKLSATEFEKKCGIETHTSPTNPVEPQEPVKINWQPPVLENVIY